MGKREAEKPTTIPLANEQEGGGESKPKRRVIRRRQSSQEGREKVSFHLPPDVVERTYLARRRLGLTRDQFAEMALLALAKTVAYSLRNDVKSENGLMGSEEIAAA